MEAEHLITEIHDFWFIEAGAEKWWKKDVEFDQAIADLYGTLVEAAAAGRLDSWATTQKGALALILLLDQFPRNIYRGMPKAFASDEKAKNLTLYGLENGYLNGLSNDESCFFLLPLEHSEDLKDQDLCVSMFQELGSEGYLGFANAHRDIILKFGRFPHRNAILNRTNTPEEADYLSDPNAGF